MKHRLEPDQFGLNVKLFEFSWIGISHRSRRVQTHSARQGCQHNQSARCGQSRPGQRVTPPPRRDVLARGEDQVAEGQIRARQPPLGPHFSPRSPIPVREPVAVRQFDFPAFEQGFHRVILRCAAPRGLVDCGLVEAVAAFQGGNGLIIPGRMNHPYRLI